MGLLRSISKAGFGLGKGIGKVGGKLLSKGGAIAGSLGADVVNIAAHNTVNVAEKTAELAAKGSNSIGKAGKFAKTVGGKIGNTVVGDVTTKAFNEGVNVTGAKVFGKTFEGNFHIPREIGTHVRAATNMVKPIGKIMFERAEEGKGGVLGFKMKGAGYAIMGGAGMVTGTHKAFGDWNNGRRGQGAPASISPTPTYQRAYENNAGATGDLALGLHKLRRG